MSSLVTLDVRVSSLAGHPRIGDSEGSRRVKATHAYTINGRTSLQLKGSAEKQEAELRRLVHVLDGVKRCSLSLWVIPDGKDFDDVDVNSYPQEYVQTAGGGDRRTVEIREIRVARRTSG